MKQYVLKLRFNVLSILMARQNGRHFAKYTFKCLFLNENVSWSMIISLKLVPNGPMNNIPALVRIMAWRRLGDKPLSQPMLVSLFTRILGLNELNTLVYVLSYAIFYVCIISFSIRCEL